MPWKPLTVSGTAPYTARAMARRFTVRTVSTSRADDAAFLALADIVRITVDFDDVRVVGGHMSSLLLTTFPVAEAIVRRTADADVAISVEVAASGDVHEALLAARYAEESGNHYVKGDQTIDLLVPAAATTFGTSHHGDRAFDAAPGLQLAMAASPLVLDIHVILLDGSTIDLTARVPSVEVAVVLKSYATVSRSLPKDYTDLYNLLCIAYAYEATETGGWKLDRAPLSGARADASRILHPIADRARSSRLLSEAGVPAPRFAALVRELVTKAA